MVRFSLLAACVALLAAIASANRIYFDDNAYSQVCSGMYSKSDWGGSIKPNIGINLDRFGADKDAKKDPTEAVHVSYVIFEYRDIDSLGFPLEGGGRKYICDDLAVDLGLCEAKQKDKFLINNNHTNSTILTSLLTHLGKANISYPVENTGYYCVSTFTVADVRYHGDIEFQNAFGQLSASEIPKLPAYGILTLCYAIALALYGFQFFKKRKENQILPLQRYLLAMLGFLTFNTLVVWSYYDLVNRNKNPSLGFVTFYMVFLSILDASKITFSFFLLLCIALGYGVVVLKLSKKHMLRCKILAGCHFAASMVYLVMTYYNKSSGALISSSDEVGSGEVGNSIVGLLPLIPMAITLTAYYLSILISIRTTTGNLHKQRQIIKLKLYQSLFRIIFLSVVFTFGGLIASSFIYLSMSTTDMIEQHWKSAFFVFEFWPSVVFFVVFMRIAWLWRPTETSYMLAISQQLATDDNGDEENPEAGAAGYHQGHEFELDDLSLLSHSDNEDNRQMGPNDSFELSRDPITGTSAPPDYNEISNDGTTKQEAKKNTEHVEPSTSNTLFELGEGDDDEDADKSDDRLK